MSLNCNKFKVLFLEIIILFHKPVQVISWSQVDVIGDLDILFNLTFTEQFQLNQRNHVTPLVKDYV